MFVSDETLAIIRDRFASTLIIPCSIWRDQTYDANLSNGALTFHHNTFMSVNLTGSGSSSPIIDAIFRAVNAKTPNARTLAWAFDEDIQTGDTIFDEAVDEADPEIPDDASEYRAGITNKDDPNRFGLQVACELVRGNPD